MDTQPPSGALDVHKTRRPGLLRRLLSRRNVCGAAVAVAARLAAPGIGLLPAIAAGLVGRFLYAHTEQRVPFTSRVHIILVRDGRGLERLRGPWARA
jgi:hypothetical protein